MHETDELILKYTPDEALAEIMHRSERIALQRIRRKKQDATKDEQSFASYEKERTQK